MTCLLNYFDRNNDGIVDADHWGPLSVPFGAFGLQVFKLSTLSFTVPVSGSVSAFGLLIATAPVTLTKYYIYMGYSSAVTAIVQVFQNNNIGQQNINVTSGTVVSGTLNPTFNLNKGDTLTVNITSSNSSSFVASVFTIEFTP
jgi:hypothetical protein